MIKNIVSIIASCVASTTLMAAQTYTFILPNPPGSSSDIVARTIADEYHRQTGNILVLAHAPGGEHIVAVNKFKGSKELTVILGTTTMHVFNHVYHKNLPYGDSEFDHIAWIGWSPHVYYVSADHHWRHLEDFKSYLTKGTEVMIGVDALSTSSNILSLQKNSPNGPFARMVRYKGSPFALADVLGGHISMAISSISPAIVAQAQAGKIRVLATTNNHEINVGGQRVPPAAKTLSADQFNGGFLISVNSEFANSSDAKILKKNLLEVVRSQAVRTKLANINIEVDGRDGSQVLPLLRDYRTKLQALN